MSVRQDQPNRATAPEERWQDGVRERAADAPESRFRLSGSSWRGVLARTVREFKEDNLTDLAAALTYYGVLAIFPALVALVFVLGLIGRSATQPLIENLGTVAPGPAKTIFTSAIQNLQKGQSTAGVIFVLGLAGALWSASGYVSAFMRASNTIYDVEEGRPFYKTVPTRLAVTLVMITLLAVSAVAVVLTGGLAKQVANLVGLGGAAVTVWDIAKWPVLLLVVSFMFSLLYWASPNAKQRGLRWISPGGVLAVGIWLLASAAFALQSPSSPPTTRPTVRWPPSSCSLCGCGSRTSPFCSGRSSTPSSTGGVACRPASRLKASRSSSRATRGR